MTAQGHPRAIFKRALERGNVVIAEMAEECSPSLLLRWIPDEPLAASWKLKEATPETLDFSYIDFDECRALARRREFTLVTEMAV